MKQLTEKQKALLNELAPQIAEYRSLQAKVGSVEVADYESAEIARYWLTAAEDVLSEIEFWVEDAYMSVPYKATRNKAIDAFMRLVVEGEGK